MRRAANATMSVVVSVAIAAMIPTTAAFAQSDAAIRDVVAQQIQPMLDGPGGVAVAVHVDGRTLFMNFGDAAPGRPVTSDSLFNLASIGKVFVSTLLAQAVKQGDVALDDPVAKYVTELQRGGDIKRVTLGQLASHTSGLTSTPQRPGTGASTRSPTSSAISTPGRRTRGMSRASSSSIPTPASRCCGSRCSAATTCPSPRSRRRASSNRSAWPRPRCRCRGEIPAARSRPRCAAARCRATVRAGRPVGAPGDEQGSFNWPGTGQIYSSARDMATFLAANLGALPNQRALQAAMAFAQQEGMFSPGPRFTQALGWGIVRNGDLTIVDKNGGMNNTSTYIGMILQRELGVVILANRGGQPATRIGRQILRALAGGPAAVSQQGRTPN